MCYIDPTRLFKPTQLFQFQNDKNYLIILTLHDYFGQHDYFDLEKRQPYTIIPYCKCIRDRRVSI